MEEEMSDLKVYMLGKFSMVYGDQPVIFKRNSATKVLSCLQILLHYSGVRGGISRNQLSWKNCMEEKRFLTQPITCGLLFTD